VAFYATPSDLISKAMILPYSLMAALFPAAAAVPSGSPQARELLSHSVRLLFVLTFPVVFAFVALAQPGLQLWLGVEFAELAAPVLRLLALGVFLNALAQGPALLIQAAGQPRQMALLHLIELPIFIGLLVGLTMRWGIVGTALAAALRNGLDGLAVLLLARRDVARGELAWRRAGVPAALAVTLLACAWWPRSVPEALAVLLGGLGVFLGYAWRVLLRPEERSRLLDRLRSLR
jgi:O-antigen/teichoic acid export membrane protein